ncbi:acyl-CoA dehydrogenase family protein [Polyangium sp. y55x31]|uniref:acyl-CoA dehydrogenase family protein n=1 Tax=Polyangium sp. y55x31 TaxID=3042688 RepID=UPI002482B94D|nr:acyl-CoA dehydrogenase family protein [Polyangium sp. y55x31]MDI1475021.1 acyl-CoA dehydrogenase family protein [Polyangium sp. y55x31]
MKLRLTAEQDAVVGRARAFASSRLRARVAEFDQAGVPREIVQALGREGLLGALVPADLGGSPLDAITWGLVTEEIGKVCCNTRYLLTVHASIVAGTLARWGSRAQKAKWLPALATGDVVGAFALSEPETGSDAANVRTRYEASEGGFRIEGRKRWTTFGAMADVFLVFARRGDEVTAFLVERDRPNVHVKPIRDVLAGRGSHLAELHFEGVEVPKENVVGSLGAGFRYVCSTALDIGRYSVAWAAVGVAQGALEAMSTYAGKREQFGQRLHEFQLVKAMIADAVTDVHAARALCMHAGMLRDKRDPEAMIESSIAKQFAARVATRVTADALQVHGAYGLLHGGVVEMLFREARALSIIEGSTQIQQIVIGDHGAQAYGEGTHET